MGSVPVLRHWAATRTAAGRRQSQSGGATAQTHAGQRVWPSGHRQRTAGASNQAAEDSEASGVGGVLDKVGGAVGSVVDRVNARIQNTQSNARIELPERESKAPTEPELSATNGASAQKAAERLKKLDREDKGA